MGGDFWSGFFQGIFFWIFGLWLLKNLLIILLSPLIKKEVEKNPEKYGGDILLYVEKHHNVLYCYRKDTHEFVGQGSTLQEIANIYKKKFPNNNGKVLAEDGAEFINHNTDAVK